MKKNQGVSSGSDPLIFLVALALAFASCGALAGRPLSTEDAAALGDRRCQVEAWVDHSRASTTRWFVPACNFGGGIEWQVGFANVSADSYAQAKKVFKELADDSPWGAGLVVGATKGVSDANPYAIVPVSFALGETLLHLNAGWSRDRAGRRNLSLWGAAVEAPLSDKLTFVAEAFGQDSERPSLRAGGRWNVTGSLALDLTVVVQPGRPRDERILSIGVFWESN